jgi:hypothetical protein
MKSGSGARRFLIAFSAGVACLPLAGFAAETAGQDASAASWFGGVRVWANTWDVPLGDMVVVIPNPLLPSPVLRQIPVSKPSSTEFSVIPYLGYRFGDFSISASRQLKSNYAAEGASDGVKRSETDLTFGYTVLPSVTASIALKEAKISQTATDTVAASAGTVSPGKIQALLIGLSGSAPISNNLGIYGNFAVGPATLKVDYEPFGSKFNGDYRVGEFGFSYRIPTGGGTPLLKGLTATVGYRTQVVKIRDLPFVSYDMSTGVPAFQSIDPKVQTSTTQGIVLGIVGSF